MSIKGVSLSSAEGAHKFGGVYVHKQGLGKALASMGKQVYILGPHFEWHNGETFSHNPVKVCSCVDVSDFSHNNGCLDTYCFTKPAGNNGHKLNVNVIDFEKFLRENTWEIRRKMHERTGLDFGFDGIDSDHFVDKILAYNIAMFKRSKELHRSDEIDVSHYHDTGEGIYGAILSAQEKLPTVFTIHSTETERAIASGGMPNYRLVEAERKGAEVLEHVIAVSDYTKSKAVKLGYREDRITVIGNGVELDKWQPRELSKMEEAAKKEIEALKGWKIGDDTIILVFVGRPGMVSAISGDYVSTTWKGAEGGLTALHKLKKLGYDAKAIYIAAIDKKRDTERVFGQANRYACNHMPHSAEASLLNLIKFLGLEKDVDFINTYADIRPYYALATHIIPLSLEEDWGITFTEGLAACRKPGKKPLIFGAANTGHETQVKIDNNAFKGEGFTIADSAVLINVSKNAWETAENFVSAFKWLENNEREARKLSEKAEKNVENFTWDKVAKQTLEVYERAARR